MTNKSVALHHPAAYDLKKSKEVVGPLLPVLKDKNGRIVDGIHRLAADKNWPTSTLHIEGVDSDLARIVVNVQRRRVSPKEKRDMLKDLAEKTGMSVSWVRKYLPTKYKNQKMSQLAKKKHRTKKVSKPNRACPSCGNTLIPVLICSKCGYMAEDTKRE